MALAIRELIRAARSQTEPNVDGITHEIQRLARQQRELGSRAVQLGIFHRDEGYLDFVNLVITEREQSPLRLPQFWT